MTPETIALRPGHLTPRIIRGGWQLAGDHGEVDRAAAIRDMEAFLDAGLTAIDCADIYTGVEEMIGDFLSELRRRRPEAARHLRIHTKLVPDLARLADLTGDEVEAIVDRSLKRTGLDRLHLVQFFWWNLATGSPLAALDRLRRCKEKGKLAQIGVTNWDAAQIAPFLDAGIEIVSAQVQYSLLDRRPAATLAPWAAAGDLHILAYGTLAGGFLTETWRGQSDPGFAFANRSLVKYRLVIDEFGPWTVFQTLLDTLHRIGQRHGVGLDAVATRWVLDQPQVAAAIVGARYARHLPRTLAVFGLRLTPEDHAEIAAVLRPGPQGPVYGLESDRQGRHGRIMKYNLNSDPNAPVGAADG